MAALIGMIPEGLYLLTSVALAVSMMRLARRKVLTRDMNCIETLARVDTLCVDKTGTITESTMQADDPLPLAENIPITEILSAFYAGGQPDNDTARAPDSPLRAGRHGMGCRAHHPVQHGVQVQCQRLWCARGAMSSVRPTCWRAAGRGSLPTG